MFGVSMSINIIHFIQENFRVHTVHTQAILAGLYEWHEEVKV